MAIIMNMMMAETINNKRSFSTYLTTITNNDNGDNNDHDDGRKSNNTISPSRNHNFLLLFFSVVDVI